MATRMQQRRGTAAEWLAADPVLQAGEIGYETDTNQFKIGDGVNSWTVLNYFKDSQGLDGNFISDVEKGVADGVATLDSSGYIPVAQLQNLITDAPGTLDTLGEISTAVSTIDTNITNELGLVYDALTASEQTLTTAIETEASERQTADDSLTSAIQTENSERIAADVTLTDAITQEVTDREDADNAILTSVGALDTRVTAVETLASETSADLALEITNRADAITSLDATLSQTISSEIADVISGYTTADATLDASITTHEDRLTAIDSEIIEITGNIAQNSSDIDVAEADIASLTASVADISTDVLNLQSSVDSNATAISSLQTETGNQLVSITQISEDLSDLSLSLTSEIAARTDLGSDVDALTLSHDTTVSNLATLEANVDVISGDLTALTSDVEGLSSDLSALQADLTSEVSTRELTDANVTAVSASLAQEVLDRSAADTALSSSLDSVSGDLAAEIAARTAADTTLSNAIAAAELAHTNELSAHTSATTDVHGIADTAELETQTGAQAKATAALEAAQLYADGLAGDYDPAGSAAAAQLAAETTASSLYATKVNAAITGSSTVENLTITGDLTVQGTTTTVAATNLEVTDSLIYLAAEQFDTDTVDIGIFGAYGDAQEGHFHTGIVRDATDGKWKLISGADEPTDSNVDFSTGTYDTLKLGAVEFADGTQTQQGVPSITYIYGEENSNTVTASFNISAANYRDKLIEVNPGTGNTVTITVDDSESYPVGTTFDVLQTGEGTVEFVDDTSTTLNYTPGNMLRTVWSSATLLKRTATSWVVYGDLN